MEYLAPEVIRSLCPWRFEHEEPAVVIEHMLPLEPERRSGSGNYRRADEYARVVFASWRPRRIWLHGQERLSLGEPDWRYLPPHEVAALIGEAELERAADAE